MKTYVVNELFFSLQGEGARAGTANVFVRFAGCNLTCARDAEGFDCDTDFSSGVRMQGEELVLRAAKLLVVSPPKKVGVIFTGGEPALQLDPNLVAGFRDFGFGLLCVETNGTRELPPNLDWITCSPKTAEHTLRCGPRVNELRYVRRAGMALPKPSLAADHLFLSPAFGPAGIDREDLEWCVKLVKENPEWRLSVQQHKAWRVR